MVVTLETRKSTFVGNTAGAAPAAGIREATELITFLSSDNQRLSWILIGKFETDGTVHFGGQYLPRLVAGRR